MYKCTLFFILWAIAVSSAGAQSPKSFTYQAVVRDEAGQVLSSEDVSVQLTIIRDNPQGTLMFSETHHTVTNDFGLVTLQVGSINSLEIINWAEHDYFLRVTVNGVLMGVTQLLSVPYALHSMTSGDTFSGSYHDLENLPDLAAYVNVPGAQPGTMFYFRGDSWQPIPPGEEGDVLMVIMQTPQWAEIGYEPSFVNDIDGNVYRTVKIGGREWMAENLRVTNYANGDRIPTGLNDDEWWEYKEGAYAVFPHQLIGGLNSEAEVVDAYGKLYSWFAAVDERGLCPTGWTVPSRAEWLQLFQYLINNYEWMDDQTFSNSLKSCRQPGSPLGGECDTNEHPIWQPHDIHYGTDDFGMGILGGGYRAAPGFYGLFGTNGAYWTTTDVGHVPKNAWAMNFMSALGAVSQMGTDKDAGFSVRCIREE